MVNSMERSAPSCLILFSMPARPSDPPPASPVVAQIRGTVEARIRELQPYMTELERLQELLAALDAPDAGSGDQLAALAQLAATPAAPTPAASTDELQPLLRRGRRGTKPGRDGRAPQGANKQKIMSAILTRPGVTPVEVAEMTGLKRPVVAATMNRLRRGGELEAYGDGVRIPLVADPAGAIDDRFGGRAAR